MSNSARQLLEILLGSASAASALDKNQKEREKIIKEFIESNKKQLRTAIDSHLPVIYLVDSREIVNSMLDILNPVNLLRLQNTTEEQKLLNLSQYFNNITDPETGEFFDSDTALVEYKQVNDFGSTKTVKIENRDFIQAYNNCYSVLESKKESIYKGIIARINREINSKVTVEQINTLIAKVGSILTSSKNSINAGAALRNDFSKIGVSIITDAEALINGFQPAYQVLVTGQSFNAVTTRVHNIATKSLEGALVNTGLTPIKQAKEGVIGFKAGNFAAAGHAGISSSSKVIGINTPQAIIASLILSKNNKNSELDIFKDLAINTTHKDFLIDINNNYKVLGQESLSIGISFVRSQHSLINSGRISSEEVKLVNNRLLQALNKSYRDLSKDLINIFDKEFKKSSLSNWLVETFRLSPSLKEHITAGMISILKNEKYVGPKGSAKAHLARKPDKSNVTSATINKTKAIPKPAKPFSAKKLTRPVQLQKNIANLETLINSGLHDQIRKNMGSGNRTDVLNYRTGRFAQSAKVERISESRQGMITVFYSYMKNPYATFSQGGRQQFPRSRDPKLLISKSIREIAQNLVSNRLRAVNV